MTEAEARAGMGISLYLRWRPRSFADVVGQEAVTRTLRNAVARGSVAHAYLLCGPRGTGKTSIARIIYRAVNCERPDDGEPCGVCRSCEAVDRGRALDLIEIDAASHGGVDDVRDLRERVSFAPVEAKTKVYIVDEAHQLTPKAWDAFLKTLEEPPPRTVFVLATTEAHKVPATIASRCQRFDLRRIPQRRVQERLELVAQHEGLSLEVGVADRLARLARGSLRDAIGMLEQVAAFSGGPVTMDAARRVLGLVRGDALRSFFDALSQGESRRALQLLEDLTDEGADFRQFLDEVLFYLRGALLVRSGAGASLETQLNAEERDWLGLVAQRWAPSEILAILRAYGEIETRARDEYRVLVGLELTSAWAAGLKGTAERDLPVVAAREAAPTKEPAAESPPPERQDSPGPVLSVASLQTRWAALLDRFEGNLWLRLMLDRVAPVAVKDNLVTLEGPLDSLELQRLGAPELRQRLEALLGEEFQAPLHVQFRAGEPAPASRWTDSGGRGSAESSGLEAQAEDLKAQSKAQGGPEAAKKETSIAELGAELFGGQLVEEP